MPRQISSTAMYQRQLGIIPLSKFKNQTITLIGCGGIGSFAGLLLGKMGAPGIDLFDDDGVEVHNLPNQFYRHNDISQFKVEALGDILSQFAATKVTASNRKYSNQKLQPTVVVATDSMSSRRLVWEQFKKQPQCKNYIEARMGAEVGRVYLIRKTGKNVSKDDIAFYEETLYSDEKAEQLPCTERAIIYNVAIIAGRICRAYKAVVMDEEHDREVVDSTKFMDAYHPNFLKRK